MQLRQLVKVVKDAPVERRLETLHMAMKELSFPDGALSALHKSSMRASSICR